jgi:hypothetical protein
VDLLGARVSNHTAYVRVEKDKQVQVRAIDWQSDQQLTVWQPARNDRETWLAIARARDPIATHPERLPIIDSLTTSTYAWLDADSRIHAIGSDGTVHALSTGPATDAAFAPRGTMLVFIAGDRLYAADAAVTTPAKPIDIRHPSSPLFVSEDRVFVVSNGCVHQVDPHLAKAQGPILCPGLDELEMIGAPDRRSAAVCGTTKQGGSMCTWLELPSGSVKGHVTSERLTPLVLGPNGLLVARSGGGMTYVSLKDEGRVRVDDQPDSELDPGTGCWLDDTGTLLALRRGLFEWDLVEIDVDRMIDGSARN